MTNYCEACKQDTPTTEDEYGVAVCNDCGNDIVQDMHVIVDVDGPDADAWWLTDVEE